MSWNSIIEIVGKNMRAHSSCRLRSRDFVCDWRPKPVGRARRGGEACIMDLRKQASYVLH